MTRLIGVVPAAGSAARLQPLPSSKEVLQVGERPVMDHIVERLRRAGCDEIRVVTRPDKQDVVEHARTLGLLVVLATPETAAASVAAGLDDVAPEDVVLLGFPDTIWEPEDGFVDLVAELSDGTAAVLGLFRTSDLRRSDVVSFSSDGRVASVAVKPERPQSSWIWGCAAARGSALAGIGAAGDIGRHFDQLARQHVVRGVTLSDDWIDIGTREGLDRALRSPPTPADGTTRTPA
jgi:glucose-1-phosphate thymidylyltransferase